MSDFYVVFNMIKIHMSHKHKSYITLFQKHSVFLYMCILFTVVINNLKKKKKDENIPLL